MPRNAVGHLSQQPRPVIALNDEPRDLAAVGVGAGGRGAWLRRQAAVACKGGQQEVAQRTW